jgi:Mn2+/Fe2+ NRAMP family transporter
VYDAAVVPVTIVNAGRCAHWLATSPDFCSRPASSAPGCSPSLAGSSAYVLAEAAHWREGLARTLRQAPGFYTIIIIGMAIGAGINLVGIPPIKALYASAILNGLAAPPIMVLMLLASRKPMLGRWRSGWLTTTLVATAVLVMTGLPLWYLLT